MNSITIENTCSEKGHSFISINFTTNRGNSLQENTKNIHAHGNGGFIGIAHSDKINIINLLYATEAVNNLAHCCGYLVGNTNSTRINNRATNRRNDSQKAAVTYNS